MMKSVVREGSGTAAALEGVELAGKTGTAEINIEQGINDLWFIGFTERRRRRRDHRPREGSGRHGRRADRQAASSRRWGNRCTRSPATRMIDGRYRAQKRLGAGGMAEVWCAEDEVLGRRVALKLMGGRFAEDPEFRERFRREAQAAAGLTHPNIVGDLRPLRVGRHALHRDGAGRRADAQGARDRARPAAAGRRGRADRAGPARARLRAPARDRPPRRQAAERDPRPRRARRRSPTSGSRAPATRRR